MAIELSPSGLLNSDATADRWLLLLHQLPAQPAYLRVKVWRRLQALGAVAVKNAVYVLPFTGEAQEDFEWLLGEIKSGGGEGVICEARLIDGLNDQDVRALFDQARDADYAEITSEARALLDRVEASASEPRDEARTAHLKLRTRFAQVVEIDFFGSNGREPAEGLLNGLAQRLADRTGEPPAEPTPPVDPISALKGRTWVTRTGVHVDRIASAWLVRRFIDENAVFKFVPPKGYVPSEGELRFDMFQAEFTHEDDRCTFEVLLARTGLGTDPALKALGEIVHDIDLKDGKFGREEAGGLKTLIAGLCLATRDDADRIARGSVLFDDLYGYFRKKRG